MKQLRDDFAREVSAWDRVHRIIGRTAPGTLFDESLAGLGELATYSTLIDIGAGSGLLGIAWLSMDPGHHAAFVEPDLKKTAFISAFLSARADMRGRYQVIATKIESVSRETLSVPLENAVCAARAFSGARGLAESYQDAGLNLPLFAYEASQKLKKFARVC